MKTFPWLSPTHSNGYTGFSCSHHPSFLFMASQGAHASGFNYNLTWRALPWTSLVWTTLWSSVLGLRSVYGCTREDVVFPLPSEVLAEIPGTKRWTGENSSQEYLVLLCFFITLHRHYRVFLFVLFFVFLKLKVCGNPASSKSLSSVFPTASAHFISLCHGLVIFAIFQTFLFVCYGDLWSVITDVADCFRAPQIVPQKMANLIDNVVYVLTALYRPAVFLSLSPSSGLPIPWETTIVKLGQQSAHDGL